MLGEVVCERTSPGVAGIQQAISSVSLLTGVKPYSFTT